MIELFQAALQIQRFLLQRDWRFCIIGGLAVARWGEPRATRDVDISLLTGFGDERTYIEQILAQFSPRIPDADQFALENRVLLISGSGGTPIDICLAGIPFEERMVERASPFAFAPEVSLVTCSAEDLVVLKAFAGREVDWVAIEGILIAEGERLDWDYVDQQLSPLCKLKEDPQGVVHLARLRKRLQARPDAGADNDNAH